jgi:hypothetical protein
MPTYINYQAVIDKTVYNQTAIFNTEKDNNLIKFVLNDEFNIKLTKSIKETQYTNILVDYLSDTYIVPTEKDINDLCQLSFEYGFENILIVLKNIVVNEVQIQQDLLGALVRNHIQNICFGKISA